MGTKGTDYGVWTGLTSTVNTNVSGISDVAELSFATTTMTPFTSFNDDIKSFNEVIDALKTFTADDITHMNQVAENKVTDDQNQANAK
ncbi:hypothetical protein LXO72_07070 [Streptococcus sp. XMC]|uniref:hypothetical protein n=1 Tax=Streptococcus sp. XMC TaxID=2905972 RepID=UPI001E46BBD7|nr:hypothetical protein [Streptococcus sp. XMC]MCE3592144.1 hypothetical protein [Streptococcus sp. XMC]